MILGPVFRAELIRTARRRRYYVLRILYGGGLLLLLWSYYAPLSAMAEYRGGTLLFSDLATFAVRIFHGFVIVQLIMLLVLVPALLGGVIADEKQRKTMHYLMASRLSSREIVLDKLLARLLHVGVFVLLGVPIISLMSLFGGVQWEYVLFSYAGTASITFFVAALTTLAATLVRRVRQGVLLAYLLTFAWLVLPPIAEEFGLFVFPKTYEWIEPINAWVMATSPISLWIAAVKRGLWGGTIRGGPLFLLDPFVWMVGLQFATGVVFLVLAVLLLRPIYRRQEGSTGRLTWFSPKRQRPPWLTRPECGEDAMLWKERHFARTDILTKAVVLPATIILTVTLVLGGQLDEKVAYCASALWSGGYSSTAAAGSALNATLRDISPFYIGLWLLAVAGASASSVTVEREEDTWISLTSTPLTGWEILRGKMIGAVWGLRGFGGLLSLFWIGGLVLGGIHPVGLLLGLSVVTLLTWFVASLGTYYSLKERTTSRAITSVIGLLVFLNGGYLIFLYAILVIFSDPRDWFYAPLGCTPFLAANTILSSGSLRTIAEDVRPFFRPLAYGTAILMGYALAATWLTQRSVRRFDEILDRVR